MRTKTLHHRLARKRRIRARVRGTPERPRLSVYRSLRGLYAQIIDDEAGKTIVAGSLREVEAPARRPPAGRAGSALRRRSAQAPREGGKHTVGGAKQLGALIAKKAKAKKIGKVVFDRNAYKYHGRVKALAEGAREGGLQF